MLKKLEQSNTVLNKSNELIGYNTDFNGALNCFKKLNVNNKTSVKLLGTGGMAKAFMAALKEVECIDVSIVQKKKFVQKYENYFDLKLHKWSKEIKQSLILYL